VIALPSPAAAKLAKVCGLLASDQPGEVVSAAAVATRILQQHGATWADLVQPCAPQPQPRQAPDHRARARHVLLRRHALTAWEVEFCESIARRLAPLTERQAATLERIARKAGA
jgi:hypothetical protein